MLRQAFNTLAISARMTAQMPKVVPDKPFIEDAELRKKMEDSLTGVNQRKGFFSV